jgi:hypothetical protein
MDFLKSCIIVGTILSLIFLAAQAKAECSPKQLPYIIIPITVGTKP